MSRSTTVLHLGHPLGVVGDQRDHRLVDALEQVGDHLVLLLEPVQHLAQRGVLRAQVREHGAVLERVVGGDDAAVGRQKAPSVQPFWRIVMRLMKERTAAGSRRPAETCSIRSRRRSSSPRRPSWTSIRCWPAPWGRGARPVVRAGRGVGPPPAHQLAHGRRRHLAEAADVVGRAHRHDQRAEPVVGTSRARSSASMSGVDVEHPADLGGRAAGLLGGRVDPLVHARHVREIEVAHARQPAVALGAGEREHPRLVGADPDLHVVRGLRPGLAPCTW